MVIYYRDRFVKFFIITFILGLISVASLIWTINSIYSLTSSLDIAPSSVSLNKLMLYASILFLAVTECLYIYCHYLLAKAKGYSAWFTLLGLLSSFIGLAILFLLPDRRKMG